MEVAQVYYYFIVFIFFTTSLRWLFHRIASDDAELLMVYLYIQLSGLLSSCILYSVICIIHLEAEEKYFFLPTFV